MIAATKSGKKSLSFLRLDGRSISCLLQCVLFGLALILLLIGLYGPRLDFDNAEARISQWISIGLIVMSGFVGLVSPRRRLTVDGLMVRGIVFILFIHVLMAPIYLSPLFSLAYTIVTSVVAVSIWQFWRLPDNYIRWTFAVVGLVYLAFSSIALYSFGIDFARYVGKLLPNDYCALVYTGFACSLLGRNRIIQIAFTGVALVLILMVASRGWLAATLITAILFFGLNRRKPITLKMLALLSAIGSIVGILWFAGVGGSVLSDVDSHLGLSSMDRGIDSGFTGRTNTWSSLIAYLPPAYWVIGAGFRSMRSTMLGAAYSSHSGLIDFVAETGVIVSVLLIAIWARGIYIQFRAASEARVRGDGSELTIRAWVIGLIFGMTFSSFFEPSFINIGSAQNLLFLSALSLSFCVRRVGKT